MRSEPLGPQQRVGEIEQEPDRHEAGKRIVENHDDAPSEPIAGQGVTDRQQEEAEPNGQHDDVPHCYAPMRLAPVQIVRFQARLGHR